MTDEERRLKHNASQREYYSRNRERCLAWWKDYRNGRGREAVLDSARRHQEKIMSDPELYAKMMDRRHTKQYSEKASAYCKQWRASHKSKVRMYCRLRDDRRRMLCSLDADFYAQWRKDNRERAALYRRRILAVKSQYRPMPSRRIPDYCTSDKVIDKRSKFLYCNLTNGERISAKRYYEVNRFGYRQ